MGTHNVCCGVGAELPNNDGDNNKLYNDDIKKHQLVFTKVLLYVKNS